jgi:hypothetical protein
MKKKIGKYIFEILVIFIGITISFLFESWRNDREGRLETKKQLTLLRNDLGRTKAWIEQIDSNYNETISNISHLKNGKDLSEEDFSLLMFKIFDNPIDFPLRDISPYLSQVSRLNETSNISGSDKIITSVAFIQTLVREDYELNKSISDYVDNRIWPKLNKNNFQDKILDAEKSWTDTTIVWTEKRYSIELFDDLKTDLSFVELKIRKIIIVHDALKRRIEILKEDLSKV